MERKVVKKLLKTHGFKPKKHLGQHFLVNESYLERIADIVNTPPQGTVLEVGAGIGNLTLKLVPQSKKIIAVEKDKKLCQILKEVLKENQTQNVKIVNKDILKLKVEKHVSGPYKIVGNIPYYLTSRLLRKTLEGAPSPEEMIFTIQKEVAERVCSHPPNMSLLAVSVQFYGDPKILFSISSHHFWPPPEVDSAVIKIANLSSYYYSPDFQETFFKVARAGFSHPRKQLANNLAKQLNSKKKQVKKLLNEAGINPKQRAETLSVEDWKILTDVFVKLDFFSKQREN